ncbi:MAG: transcription termination factor Rho [Pseudomonadota bacterium]|nr:transcription termination factor Rho [Pseudomonadota bacterium]
MPLDLGSLRSQSIAELIQTARTCNIENASSLKKQDLVAAILRETGGATSDGSGVLEILPDGFGFLRATEYSFHPGSDDVYVSPSQIRRFNLRTGDLVGGQVRAPKENERYFALIKVERVNGEPPESAREKVLFENLTSVWPRRRLHLADPQLRLLSACAPFGFGQRALVVGTPRSGRSTLLQRLATDIAKTRPDVALFVVLIAERPEEVTEAERTVPGTVLATTFDEPDTRHVQVAEMAIERAKRLVEHRRDVVMLFDSLDRFAAAAGGSAGGLEASALLRVRRVFGAARECEEGGSFSLFATADTDGPVAHALRDAATSEIRLDTEIARRGLWPALDLRETGTLRADRLQTTAEVTRAARVRTAATADAALALLDASLHDASPDAAALDRAAPSGK